LGKLILPADPTEFLPEQRRQHGMESLPLFEDTFKALIPLPPYHRDPSDRILIAQALQNEMTLVTCDPQITQYQVPVLPLS
jgi:PIN domain nuclease of toxin-antitoxin system